MKVRLHGEEIDYHDDEALRSHSTSHAIALCSMVKGSDLRRHLEGFFSDVYLLTIKAGGLEAYCKMIGATSVPMDSFSELVMALRIAVGEQEPELSIETQEQQDERREAGRIVNTDGDLIDRGDAAANDASGSAGGAPGSGAGGESASLPDTAAAPGSAAGAGDGEQGEGE